MPVNAGDVLRCIVKMEQDGEDCINVYHMGAQSTSTVSDSDIVDLMAGYFDAAYTNIEPNLPQTTTFGSVEVINVTDSRAMGEVGFPTLVDGGSANEMLPFQVSPLVRFPTTVLGSQGRKFLPAFTEGASGAGGLLSTGTILNLANYAIDLIGGAIDGDLVEYIPGNWSETYQRFAPWVAALVNAYQATQRRRQRGVGS